MDAGTPQQPNSVVWQCTVAVYTVPGMTEGTTELAPNGETYCHPRFFRTKEQALQFQKMVLLVGVFVEGQWYLPPDVAGTWVHF